jgi:hypothetical protein
MIADGISPRSLLIAVLGAQHLVDAVGGTSHVTDLVAKIAEERWT